MMIDQIRRNNHQYNNDDHSNQKIRVPPPQNYIAWSRRRHLLHHLPAFLNAPLPFLQSLLPLILRSRTLSRSRTEMLHPATHIAVVALGLLLLGIRRGYLLGLRGSRPGNSRPSNACLVLFTPCLPLFAGVLSLGVTIISLPAAPVVVFWASTGLGEPAFLFVSGLCDPCLFTFVMLASFSAGISLAIGEQIEPAIHWIQLCIIALSFPGMPARSVQLPLYHRAKVHRQ